MYIAPIVAREQHDPHTIMAAVIFIALYPEELAKLEAGQVIDRSDVLELVDSANLDMQEDSNEEDDCTVCFSLHAIPQVAQNYAHCEVKFCGGQIELDLRCMPRAFRAFAEGLGIYVDAQSGYCSVFLHVVPDAATAKVECMKCLAILKSRVVQLFTMRLQDENKSISVDRVLASTPSLN